MKKYQAVNKRNGKDFIVKIMEDKALVREVEIGSKEKEVSLSTIKRWYELGKEIEVEKEVTLFDQVEEVEVVVEEVEPVVEVVEEVKVEEKKPSKKKAAKKKSEKKKEKYRPSATKKDGTVREDKFRPKLTEEEVIEIRVKYKHGSKKSHLAREYEVSFRTITCIVDRLMWKHVI